MGFWPRGELSFRVLRPLSVLVARPFLACVPPLRAAAASGAAACDSETTVGASDATAAVNASDAAASDAAAAASALASPSAPSGWAALLTRGTQLHEAVQHAVAGAV